MNDSLYLLCRDYDAVLEYARDAWNGNDLSREQMRLLSKVLAKLIVCMDDVEALRNTL